VNGQLIPEQPRKPYVEMEILDWVESKVGPRSIDKIGLKIGEESGEVIGEIVRLCEGRKDASFDKLDKEIGDLLIVVSQLAARRGKTLEQIRRERFEEVRERTWEMKGGQS
jgi:NTP pyrophosphatase (non-canonical NTP hydrolase)